MGKKKRKPKTSLGLRIFGIIMLLVMIASPIISILAYVIK